MDTRQSEHSRAKSQTQIKLRNPFELLIKIIRLPNVCNKCGHITRMKEISDILEQFDTMTSQQIDIVCAQNILIEGIYQIYKFILQRRNIIRQYIKMEILINLIIKLRNELMKLQVFQKSR